MDQPEITVEQGKLRGSTALDIQQEKYYKFQGIPYAKPPLGEFRFKAPVPPEKWTGTFDATKEGSCCYARDLYQNKICGSEDCLVLNVYTKNLPTKNNKLFPVLFWIHGGAFLFGSGNTDVFGPDFLITENVVVVTINYRLGMLGFLSLEDSSLDIPGNAGFKDMIMALKWVQKNINHFGGDPNNVTIFGESAGGASVHLLLLSQMAKGLFHKAIAQSGCALNPWVRGKPCAKQIASVLGLESSDEKTILKVLMKKSVQEIYEIQEKMMEASAPNEISPFGLVIEKKSNKLAFLSEEPTDIMLEGKFNHVPFMIGYTTGEGMVFDFMKRPNSPDYSFENVIPWFFGYQNGSGESKAVASKIKEFYFGSEEPSPANIRKKYDMLSDAYFIYGIYVTIVSQYSNTSASTYLYRVSIETTLNFFKRLLGITVPGVSHCDDVGYLFKTFATPEIKPGSLEETSYKRFVRLWTNFATYGNPTPNKNDPLLNVIWNPVQRKEINFLDIGEKLVPLSNPELERINFWKNLFANSPAGQKCKCSYVKCNKS